MGMHMLFLSNMCIQEISLAAYDEARDVCPRSQTSVPTATWLKD